MVTGMFSVVENKSLPVPVCTECPFTNNELQVGGLSIQGYSNVHCVLYSLMDYYDIRMYMFLIPIDVCVYLCMYLLTHTLCLPAYLYLLYVCTYIGAY